MFPSYTWAGWKGVDLLNSSTSLWPDHRFDVLIGIEEVSTGNRISPEDYVASMNEVWIINRFKMFVNLTGWMAHTRFTDDNVLSFELDIVHFDILKACPRM